MATKSRSTSPDGFTAMPFIILVIAASFWARYGDSSPEVGLVAGRAPFWAKRGKAGDKVSARLRARMRRRRGYRNRVFIVSLPAWAPGLAVELGLFTSLRCQCFNDGDIRQQLRRQTMPLLQVLRAVV